MKPFLAWVSGSLEGDWGGAKQEREPDTIFYREPFRPLQCVTRDNKFKPIKSFSGLLYFEMWRLYVKIWLLHGFKSFYADFYQLLNLWPSNKL